MRRDGMRREERGRDMGGEGRDGVECRQENTGKDTGICADGGGGPMGRVEYLEECRKLAGCHRALPKELAIVDDARLV